MADELRLKVSASDYEAKCTALSEQISILDGIQQEYEQLQSDAAVQVLGDGDSNLEQLKENVRKNILAVQGQRDLLQKSLEMLQEQNESLGVKSDELNKLLEESADAAVQTLRTFKSISDLLS